MYTYKLVLQLQAESQNFLFILNKITGFDVFLSGMIREEANIRTRSAEIITGIYAVLGMLWIFVSYQYVRASLTDEGQITLLTNQTLLRLGFIVVSSLMLFLLMRTYNRKRESAALQNLQLFLQNPQPMYVFERETLRFLAVNTAAIMKYGYSREEFLKMTLKDIRPPEDAEKLKRDIQLRRTGFRTAGLWRHLVKDGTLIYVEISSHHLRYNNRDAELILANDVTKRVKFEEQLIDLTNNLERKVNERTRELHNALQEQAALLEELETSNEELQSSNEHLREAQQMIETQARQLVMASETKLQEVLSNVHDFIWSARYYNGAFEVEMMSPAVDRVLGFSPEEYQQNQAIWFNAIHPDDRNKNIGFLSTLGQDHYRELEYRVVHLKTKDVKHVLSRVWASPAKEGNGYQLNGIMTDITDRKIQEEEKTRLIQQLLEQNNDLLQFSYIASHNLRGPVSSILGLANLVDAHVDSSTEMKDLFKHLKNSTLKLDEVIKDLTRILEIRDHESLPKEWIDLEELLAHIEEMLQESLEKNKGVLVRDLSGFRQIFSIKGYLHSIVYNLTANAIKYRSPARAPRIEVTTRLAPTEAQLIFRDNGMGIDMQKYGRKVFNLYQRFHLHVEGKGLGLYLVRTQVMALGGRIVLNSQPDQGCEFIVSFPLDAIQPA